MYCIAVCDVAPCDAFGSACAVGTKMAEKAENLNAEAQRTPRAQRKKEM
jgi:hypothetical protein